MARREEDDAGMDEVEVLESRLERFLDRLDAAIIVCGRTVWRAIVEGLAACGAAQCAVHLDIPCNLPARDRDSRKTVSSVQYSPAARDENDIRDDFEDLRSLIESVRAMHG
ncbi:MAG TPA: hypothetical protein VGC09_11250 [Rhodopila sp.]